MAISAPDSFPLPLPRPPPFRPGDATQIMPAWTGVIEGRGNAPWGIAIVDGTQLDNPPRTRLQVPPAYPPDARRGGQGGEVLVEFIVDETGRVQDPHIVQSSHRSFEEPTLRAVARWRFEPGRRDGRVVRFRMAVPVVFKLAE